MIEPLSLGAAFLDGSECKTTSLFSDLLLNVF